jgi:hypothetical protein
MRNWIDLVESSLIEAVAVTSITSPDQLDANSKIVFPTLYRGVEGGTDAAKAIRTFRGGDIGDGVYLTAEKWLAASYSGGPKSRVSDGSRAVHAYTIRPLFPEEVAFVFGGRGSSDPSANYTSLVSGNGIELWAGKWSPQAMEQVLADDGIKVVVGTPKSIGLNQICVRDFSLLKNVNT